MEYSRTRKKKVDLEANNQQSDNPEQQVQSTIEGIMKDELTLKYKCVVAYLILMLWRIFFTLISKEKMINYYEYVTCASLMIAIIAIYKVFSIGGLSKKNITFLNSFIPITIMTSAIWHMANMESKHFESQEAWAFCQCQIWNICLMAGVFFQMPIRQQLFFAISGTVALVYNIEINSSDPSKLRFRTYPKFFLFNLVLIMVAIQLAKLKDTAIRQLRKRNADLYETQRIILNSMTQGIILCQYDENKKSAEQVFFLNNSIKTILFEAVQHYPFLKQKLQEMMIEQKCSDHKNIDFLNNQDFMNLKLLVKKKDQYEEKGSNSSSKTTDNRATNLNTVSFQEMVSQDPKIEMVGDLVLSLNDIISSVLTFPESFTSLTFQLQLPNTNEDQSDVDSKQFFCLQVVDHIIMNDKTCKMVQFIDISKTVQYDEAVQQKQFASMLNATVSHEMRGPICSISQNIDQQAIELENVKKEFKTFSTELESLENNIPETVLQKSNTLQKKFKTMRKFAKKCDKSIKDMDHLKSNILTGSKLLGFYVQDLLDLAQIRSGKIVKNIERTDINEILLEILQTQNIGAKYKKVNLMLKKFSDKDKFMDIDPKRLQQVTLNLLTNAMKFSLQGGNVEIGGKILKETSRGKTRKFVQIYVQDDGYGISPEDKKKLFKLFGKLSQNSGVNKHGIGLGLHICKQICELFDGDIDVVSELGKGSRFFFKFMIDECEYSKDVEEENCQENEMLQDSFGKHDIVAQQKEPEQEQEDEQEVENDDESQQENEGEISANINEIDLSFDVLSNQFENQQIVYNHNQSIMNAKENSMQKLINDEFDDEQMELPESDAEDLAPFRQQYMLAPKENINPMSMEQNYEASGQAANYPDKIEYDPQSVRSNDVQLAEIPSVDINSIISEDSAMIHKKYFSNVLIADDQHIQLQSLAGQIKYIKGPDHKNQSCDMAKDGRELVKIYKERLNLTTQSYWKIRPYTVIITDLHMPGFSGFEAVSAITQAFEDALGSSGDIKKRSLRPKIIIHSGEKNSTLKESVEKTTQMKFLYKPASIEELQKEIGPYLPPLQDKNILNQ